MARDIAGQLAQVPLFSGLLAAGPADDRARGQEIDHTAGTVIAREGEPGVGPVRDRSTATAEVTIGGKKKATLGPGDFFGEIALLDGGPRTATVTAHDRRQAARAHRVGVPRADAGAPVDRREDAAADGGAAAFRHQGRHGLNARRREPIVRERRSRVDRARSTPNGGRRPREAAKDFAAADALRDRIAARGLDGRRRARRAGGWSRSPLDAAAGPPRRRDVVSVLDEPPTADVVDPLGRARDGPRTSRRAIASFRAHAGDRDVQYVVADVTGEPADAVRRRRRGRAARARHGMGRRPQRRAATRSRGRVVLVMDGSIEATGDVLGPLEAALADPTVGVAGPFGIVTQDLREFDEHGRRRTAATRSRATAWRCGARLLTTAGLFDEKFRWYRTADIEYSFRVKDLGLRDRRRRRSR